MRLNKLFLTLAFAILGLTYTSCTKDEADIFEKSSPERLQEVLDKTKETLTSSQGGWIFEYYPDRKHAISGYVYILKFDEQTVTAQTELTDDKSMEFTSLYRMTNDNGPTLTFDSYNEALHFFAEPSSNRYEAYDGDFEFTIMEVTDNLIRLRGKRTGNMMLMHRFNGDAAEYLNGVVATRDNFVYTEFTGKFGDLDVTASVDLSNYITTIQWGEGENDWSEQIMIPTPTGFSFASPLKVKDAEIKEFTYDADARTLTAQANGKTLTMEGKLPEDYSFYNDYVGNFTINYSTDKTLDVEIVPSSDKSGYLIKGLSSKVDIYARYNKGRGYMEICSQQVGVSGSDFYWVCGWAIDPKTNSGSFSWSTDAGMYLVKDVQNPGTFKVASNDYDGLPGVNSFIFVKFAGTLSGSTYSVAAAPWEFANKSAKFTQITSFVKK